MLESIKITNLALISKSQVNFVEGFNVLSGETGAGKSLIVDALLFLTGIRADKTLIKSGEDFARVEGVFSVSENNEVLNDILNSVDIQNEGTLIVSRYFAINGKNECRINGELVTLNILRKVSNQIIDIFGQNDSMVLLNPENHLGIIDSIIEGKLVPSKDKLKICLQKLDSINSQIKELGGLDKDRENNIRLLQFQIDEISNADLKLDEEENLKNQIKVMENSEKIYASLNDTVCALDGDFSISNMIKTAINCMGQALNFDEQLQSEKDRLYSCKYELEDIISNIISKRDDIHYNEQELDMLNDRLSFIKDLERKYGNSIEEIFASKDNFEIRLDMLINAEEKLNDLVKEKKLILSQILDICLELRHIREIEINKFKLRLISELQKLGMKNANFDVVFLNALNLENIENLVNENGADKIEFLFSANLGVELRPLSKIISGGEMSRFMLALKSLQNVNSNKTCIFDEIDTGIGGEIGVVIGEKLCEISSNSQVICITHLAQIASFGDNNLKIEKFDKDNVTITQVSSLDKDGKIVEIARMLGSATSNSSLQLSCSMIENSDAFKKNIQHLPVFKHV